MAIHNFIIYGYLDLYGTLNANAKLGIVRRGPVRLAVQAGVVSRADGGGDARHRQPARGQLRQPVRARDAVAGRRRR